MTVWLRLAKFASFETKRLRLRPLSFNDSRDFFEITSSDPPLPFIFPRQSTQFESDLLLTDYFMKMPLGIWGIEEKLSQKLIGVIRFENIDTLANSSELGYFLNRLYWGKGYMTEALNNIADMSFQFLGLKTLKIVAHKENIASRKVAEKVGFALVERYKGSDRYTHKIRQYVAYALKSGDVK